MQPHFPTRALKDDALQTALSPIFVPALEEGQTLGDPGNSPFWGLIPQVCHGDDRCSSGFGGPNVWSLSALVSWVTQ